MGIATLIASDRLTRDLVSDASEALAEAGLRPDAPEWIDEGSACDLAFKGSSAIARAALSEFSKRIDIAVQADGSRAKRLLVADMDSTMITVECIDELADYAGIKPEVSAITEAAMRGELDFAAALDARVRLLAGMSIATVDACRRERVRPTAGAEVLVDTMRARGAYALLVSGGFTLFADPVASALGFDRAVANLLVVRDGHLTGGVERPIVDAAAKADSLVRARDVLGLAQADTLAVGDGANDIAMIEAAGLGIAYHAKPALVAAADICIAHNDLTALLWVQGIPRAAWCVRSGDV